MSLAWPRAAVFDLDGLLVDSQPCWDRAFHAATGVRHELGSLAGASIADAARALAVSPALLEDQLLTQVRAHGPTPLPGALALLGRLRDRMPIAVASNGPRRVVREILERLDLSASFGVVVTADDVPRAKPAPDMYLRACGALGVDPSDVVAFEDSSTGARAALAAGAVVIGVLPPPGKLPEADLLVRRLDDHRVLRLLRMGR